MTAMLVTEIRRLLTIYRAGEPCFTDLYAESIHAMPQNLLCSYHHSLVSASPPLDLLNRFLKVMIIFPNQ